MFGRILKVVTGAGALAGSALAIAGAHFARQLAMPQVISLAKEKEWEIGHGLWGDYDSYPRTNYIVAGKDGYNLHCEYAEANPGSRKYVILTHGYTSNRYGEVKYAGVFARLGFNCILYDCRGHGENTRTACSIGYLEAEDLRHVIEDTYRRFGTDIELGLHGESMGCATSLNVLKYHPDVKFVVADCGFANFYDLVGHLYRDRHVGFLQRPVNFMLGRMYHIDMKKNSPRDVVRGSQVPVCLIHGAADGFVPSENSDELAAAAAGYHELHKIEGAHHAGSRLLLGEEKYAKIVETFLENAAAQENGGAL